MKGNIVELSAQMVWALFVMHAQKYRKRGYLFKDTIRLAAATLSKIHLWLFVYLLMSEVPNENCVSKCITLTQQENILKKSLDMIHKYILS